MCRYLIFNIITILLTLSSCLNQSRLDQALSMAGSNRVELEKVLAHYADDPEKLKAARYLIENMPGHYSIIGEGVERYYQRADSIFKLPISNKEHKKLLEWLTEQIDNSKFVKKPDLQILSSDFLIAHIDLSFGQWKNLTWNDHLTFEDFCEYLLPYKNIEGEYPELWKASLEPHFKGDIDNIALFDQFKKSPFWFCTEVNQAMPPRKVIQNKAHPLLRMSTLAQASFVNSCDEYTLLTQAVMRSKGIPVATDHTPQWPRYGTGHVWSVVLTDMGKTIVFSGGEASPGEPHKQGEKRSKVFRNTYAINPELEELLLSGEKLPSSFPHPFLKDVSCEYFEGMDVVCSVDPARKGKNRYAYLCLSRDGEWIPIYWGKIEGNRARFKNMGKDCVYLPAIYSGGALEPVGAPFLLKNNGEQVPFVPNKKETISCGLTRKYPRFNNTYQVSRIYHNARFEASNDPDFQTADTLHTIQERVISPVTVVVNQPMARRYWRFITGKGAHYNNAAELFFYDKDGHDIRTGKPIGSEDSVRNTAYSKEVVFDRDGLTYFFSRQKDSTWVGLDFGQPTEISKIVFVPRSDDNNVWPGDDYELCYWDNGGWVSLGKQTATDFELTYSNIPDGALLWLKNHTKGDEERIFSLKEGKQIWY